MKINQDMPFSSSVVLGSGGTLYAITNEVQIVGEDGSVFWEADAIRIQSQEEASKAIRAFLIDSIRVTTSSGKMFDGNDAAIVNMSAAIQASITLGVASTMWKMADNSVVEVTLQELQEALALSIQAKGKIILGAQ